MLVERVAQDLQAGMMALYIKKMVVKLKKRIIVMNGLNLKRDWDNIIKKIDQFMDEYGFLVVLVLLILLILIFSF